MIEGVMMEKQKFHWRKERNASLHYNFCCISDYYLGKARHPKKSDTQEPYENLLIISIIFRALALEAMLNAIGKSLYNDDWEKDFEKSSPRAKIRIICQCLDINVKWKESPWNHILSLISTRNNLVHAKPEIVKDLGGPSTEEEVKDVAQQISPSKLEKKITIGNAENWKEAFYKFKDLLCDKLPTEGQAALWCQNETISRSTE